MGEKELLSWPGGIATLAGGTRKTVGLSRPWQKDIAVDQERCPFEESVLQQAQRTVIAHHQGQSDNWLVLQNLFTPFEDHLLILPATCWPTDKLRALGGTSNILAALQIATTLIKVRDYGETVLTVNIGYYAGQNQPHLHYHLFRSPVVAEASATTESLVSSITQQPTLVILSDGGHKAVAGGHRAGECLIVPNQSADDTVAFFGLASFLNELISLYLDKFRSTEGLPPDYTLGLRFSDQGFRYGVFIPILNQWGASEYLALLGDGPAILPWPHQVTANHLRSASPER